MKQFTSQVCTTIEQSQRLLEMGLKPETADMVYEYEGTYPYDCNLRILEDGDYISSNIITEDIPAWSLNRLIEMLPKIICISPMQWYLSITPYYNDMVAYEHCGNMESNYLYKSFCGNIYDNIITCIEWLTNENYFNKEYLK